MKHHLMAGTVALSLMACAPAAEEAPSPFAALEHVATVSERYQSYNVEMVEVTGGRFWAPYGGPPDEVYRMRPPEHLDDERLRALTRHLGPAYMRVSGTWANTTYLEAEGENLDAPPAGYNQVLTREQWRGVVDFAEAVDAKIGVSFAVGEGARDENGVWQTDQAQRLIDLTKEVGGKIAYAEFINEPNAASFGSLPEGYSVADYTRDFAIFLEWAKAAAPDMKIVGPGGVGESKLDQIPVADTSHLLLTKELMKASPNTVDAVSYHFYGDVSERCANMRPSTADKSAALSPEWLDLTLRDLDYYSGLRDEFEPGDTMWVTETAQAACGGSPWASTYLDTFRYVNQLGLLASRGVEVVFHNTLGASDYSLIEEETRNPRPNYWAAVLWQRVMSPKVLIAPQSPSPELRLYAHCLADTPGGVGLAAVNIGEAGVSINVGERVQVWTFSADQIDAADIKVNGATPRLEDDGALSGLESVEQSGQWTSPRQSVSFLAAPDADNPACR